MNAYTKKLFSDWKTYVMIISTVMMVFVDCSDCDYLSAVWVVLAFALWCLNYMLLIGLTEYRRICDKHEELNSEAQVVMSIQAEIIKELTDKLDGRKDNADSGAGVVAEEALQAHEE